MSSEVTAKEVNRRRTFAIISHPDAGKTTLTEKLLLFGGAIQMAGTVKGRKATRHATSDWMRLEQERGISITSSVMQFPYDGALINLLDTPGHEDFSEDTYRTLTAVDSALMVIDAAKGVEARTIKLMEVCRLRTTPIISFVNKLDRDGREPVDLLDDIESVLDIKCAPMTWPIGMGREFRGIYHLAEDCAFLIRTATAAGCPTCARFTASERRSSPRRSARTAVRALREELELVRGATRPFEPRAVSRRQANTGVLRRGDSQLSVCASCSTAFVHFAPPPQPRATKARRSRRTRTRSGFRVQDPSEHGPGAPRPHRVLARLLGRDISPACACTTRAWGAKCASATRLRSWPRTASTSTRPTPATSSACTTTARSTSATASRRASRSCSPGFRASRRSCSGAPCSETR